MTEWIARYEEGYVTVGGETVTLADALHPDHPWSTPAEARAHWAQRDDLRFAAARVTERAVDQAAAPGVARFGNGLEQSDDVSERAEFADHGIVSIWRRVTFVRAQAGIDGSKAFS